MSLDDIIRMAARILNNESMLLSDASGPDELVINIDGYAASLSRLPFMSWSDWGYKATVAAASDVIAAGGRPVAIAYSVGLDEPSKVIDVASGVAEASKLIGALVYKADTNRSPDDSWIDVAVVGRSRRKVSRAGARPGDVVIQAGYVGYGAVAARLLERKLREEQLRPEALQLIRRPRPLVQLSDVISQYATASSDNSDGWAAALDNIARASNVRIELSSVVIDPLLYGIIDEWEALASGEDYALAFTVPEAEVSETLRACGSLCTPVGHVTAGSGVYLRGREVSIRGWSWW